MEEQTTETTETTETTPSESLLDAVSEQNIFANGKPESFPDDFWDKEKNAPIPEKLFDAYLQQKSRADGLRQKLSKGEFEGKAPEDVSEYKLELSDELKPLIPEGDPLFEAAKNAAKEAGLPKETFAKFMTPIVAAMAEMQPKEPTAEEIAAYKSQELEKLGPSGLRVAANVKAFVNELGAKGVLMPEDVKVAEGMVTTAEQLKVWNRLRSYMGNTQDVPVELGDTASISKAELQQQLVQAATARDEVKYAEIAAKLRKYN